MDDWQAILELGAKRRAAIASLLASRRQKLEQLACLEKVLQEQGCRVTPTTPGTVETPDEIRERAVAEHRASRRKPKQP
jgi:hypothetical protein